MQVHQNLSSCFPNSTEVSKSSQLLFLIKRFMDQIKLAIEARSPTLPIHSFDQTLNPKSLTYSLIAKQALTLTTSSLPKLLRLLEICLICIDNLTHAKSITKRNLYYRLEKYYGTAYGLLDADLRILSHNLYALGGSIGKMEENRKHISRTDLGIVPSNRCVMFGDVFVLADNQVLSNQQKSVICLPTCRVVEVHCKQKIVLIVEKESFFYEIVKMINQYKLWHTYLVISAKGYPDQNTRTLLLQIQQQQQNPINKIYYLGDYDVYGFDIFLFYALGDWNCKGLLSKIQLIPVAKYFDTHFQPKMTSLMAKFSKEDEVKGRQICNKIMSILNKRDMFQKTIIQKLDNIMHYFEKFIQDRNKCELQLLMDAAFSNNWVHQLIQKQQQLP